MSDDATISFLDLTQELRRQIDEAQTKLEESGREAVLNLETVEATITVVAERTTGGGITLAVPFFGAGAKHDRLAGQTHSITLTMKPAKKTKIAGKAET